jgi:hypothetical protein
VFESGSVTGRTDELKHTCGNSFTQKYMYRTHFIIDILHFYFKCERNVQKRLNNHVIFVCVCVCVFLIDVDC